MENYKSKKYDRLKHYAEKYGNGELLEELSIAASRYEKIRKLDPRQFFELWNNALKSDKKFDDLVDELK